MAGSFLQHIGIVSMKSVDIGEQQSGAELVEIEAGSRFVALSSLCLSKNFTICNKNSSFAFRNSVYGRLLRQAKRSELGCVLALH